jgi:hypothetical protein
MCPAFDRTSQLFSLSLGGFAQKARVVSKIAQVRILNLQEIGHKTDFLGKVPSGAGGVRGAGSEASAYGADAVRR